MSQISNYLENKMVDLVFRGQSYSAPTLYVGLYTAIPSAAGGGTEVSGNNYSRVKTIAGSTPGLGDWNATQGGNSAASSGTTGNTTNANAVTFTTPSASWGTVQWFGLFDAASGGNLIFWGPLTIPKVINNGDTVSFPAGSLSVTFS
jgi:hypothetical protein